MSQIKTSCCLALFMLVCSTRIASSSVVEKFPFPATGLDPAVLKSDARVVVTETPEAWIFTPAKGQGATALIFCPGGGVEPIAYASVLRKVAEGGYRVFLVKTVPSTQSVEVQKRDGLARIKGIMAKEKSVKRWVVGGHSLGGAIAALVAREQPEQVDGLILVATTHPRDFDLSGFDRPVTKVYATLDGVARPASIRSNAKLLPKSTRWVLVEGGNHAQFGQYGPQFGDKTATIKPEKQREILADALVESLKRVEH